MARKRKSTSTRADRPAQKPRREETPEAPPVIYVTRPKDEKIFLDTLPKPASDIVCGYLASGGHFEDLANYRKANKGCKASVDEFFKEKKNIPQVDAIILKEMEEFGRTRIKIELRIRKETLPLRPHLADLEDWAKSVARDGELVCITIPMRHRTDPVLQYVDNFLGRTVKFLDITNLRSTGELAFINRKLLGTTKIRKIKIWKDVFQISKTFSDELFAMIKMHEIHSICIHLTMFIEPPSFDPKNFVKDLIRLVHEGSIHAEYSKRLTLDDQFWQNIREENIRDSGELKINGNPLRTACNFMSVYWNKFKDKDGFL